MLAVNRRAANLGVAEMTMSAMMTIKAMASTSVNPDCERFMPLPHISIDGICSHDIRPIVVTWVTFDVQSN